MLATLQRLAAASALSATTAPVASRAAFAEWLVPLCPGLDGSRATLADDDLAVTAARAYNADQVIFSIGNDALLSPVAAYADKDVGPPLRDIALQAGPGFGVVAVAGLLAAEKIRGFRSRRQQGEAAAAAGIVVPSRWGPYARLLWDEPVSVEADQQLVDQAVALLLPILETTARRAWTAPDPEEEKPAFLSEKWAWQAMYEDGGSRSWSRGELTDPRARSASPSRRARPPAGDAREITGQAVRSFNFRAEVGGAPSPAPCRSRASRATVTRTRRSRRSRGACPRATSRRRSSASRRAMSPRATRSSRRILGLELAARRLYPTFSCLASFMGTARRARGSRVASGCKTLASRSLSHAVRAACARGTRHEHKFVAVPTITKPGAAVSSSRPLAAHHQQPGKPGAARGCGTDQSARRADTTNTMADDAIPTTLVTKPKDRWKQRQPDWVSCWKEERRMSMNTARCSGRTRARTPGRNRGRRREAREGHDDGRPRRGGSEVY